MSKPLVAASERVGSPGLSEPVLLFSDDEITHFKNTRRILDELQIPLHGSADYLILREICHVVSQRSAAITAAGKRTIRTSGFASQTSSLLGTGRSVHASRVDPCVCSAIAALLMHLGRPRVSVGVGGALVQFHPTYQKLLEEQLDVLAPPDVQVSK